MTQTSSSCSLALEEVKPQIVECFLCIEEKTMEYMFHCNACKYINCVDCHKTYLLTSTQDPHCMNCRAIIPYDIFLKKFGSKWIFDKYKKHRYNVLWDRQQSFMPQTVYKIGVKRKIDVLEKFLENNENFLSKEELEQQKELKKEYEQIDPEINEMKNKYSNEMYDCNCKIDILKHKISKNVQDKDKENFKNNKKLLKETKQKLIQINHELPMKEKNMKTNKKLLWERIHDIDIKLTYNKRDSYNQLYELRNHLLFSNKKKLEKVSYNYNYRCPVENCKGFLNEKFVCEICDANVCSKCYVKVDIEKEYIPKNDYDLQEDKEDDEEKKTEDNKKETKEKETKEK